MLTNEKLNQTAMEIILHAGNGRNKIHQALKLAISDTDASHKDSVQTLLKEAGEDINKAHRVQTQIMQDYIEQDVSPTILFSHAQDTLMTIIAEKNMAKYMMEINYKIGVK
ncbi:hypothetical protein AOC36_10670 [Erysipelothrix larvae]|uniref:PTS lactose transporter subunit IIA n=1 Tax=Erysipelothrix larvae TaxID=1514105 RepID=A0A0X8H1M8_9FIRM|nr:PTS lactose/cellobiose transporter subunit IIA [Erysipelothrix larvae]AMC94417.1 hypothetical protein AOC36_10670 [Erysipelothrix larvae]